MTDNGWRPTASIDNLKRRAEIIRKIRQFFTEREVLEVETPTLCPATVTDQHIQSFSVNFLGKTYYLQTSPEYAMKRLLAAGSGCIYQITKAYRYEAVGRRHNPEFSMLEWYRLGYDHLQLMREVEDLLRLVLPIETVNYLTYAEAFKKYLFLDCFEASIAELIHCAKTQGLYVDNLTLTDKDDWLNLLFSYYIEPKLQDLTFIYDFPASQAALAKVRQESYAVASRFEAYFRGVELANGFHELQDVEEQRERFLQDLALRKQQDKKIIELDELFLAALKNGLPDCSGVALGVDRLIMLALNAKHIKDIMAFPLT